MFFLKSQPRLHFLYNGEAFDTLDCTVSVSEGPDALTTVYRFPDGLCVTNAAVRRGDAYEWVNWFENTGDSPSGILSELWDCCVTLPLDPAEPKKRSAYLPAMEDVTAVYAPFGSGCVSDDFRCDAERLSHQSRLGHLYPGQEKEYTASNGFSSLARAPFFRIQDRDGGYMVAVGWSGQWRCRIGRTENGAVVRSGIENACFRLLPGEKLCTSSVVILPYEGGPTAGSNKWRRLVKEHYSLIGREGRDAFGPLSATIWGGMKTASVLDRVRIIRENGLPYEYIWMDAGWYGEGTGPSPDEFEGDWSVHAGDWRVSEKVHPGGLRDVSAAIHDAGMKFLLWVEIERALKGTPVAQAHPEYFLEPSDPNSRNLLLDLGNPEAWRYAFNTLAGLIETVGIDCYRQDCNFGSLLPYWEAHDAEDRRGITEIRHINGLYALWDALLARFPHLLIDNCCGGGRRIDIETLRRSIPLWRSDFECAANYPCEGSQSQGLSFSRWMPYHGTGPGRAYDTYRFRSAWSPALTAQHTFSEREGFGSDPEKLAWLKTRLTEYLQIRPLLSADFYPLTAFSDNKDAWCASRYDRPEEGDGLLLFFRREESPFETAVFTLGGISPTENYVFRDLDTGEETRVGGAELSERGLRVTLPEKRSSKVLLYKKAAC